MNYSKLMNMQKELDERIVKEHQLEGKDLNENKILALLVEMSELANETRCFKHWSTKGPSEHSILLEEYVDSLHFFLSIANSFQYDLSRLLKVYEEDLKGTVEYPSLVSAFKGIMMKILVMESQQDAFHFIDSFTAYLQLGSMLGFSQNQIEEAYIRKNEINHKRQDSGY
jgi:dimeric dUTPase (all-alpha-NTP-PPase superfamily)